MKKSILLCGAWALLSATIALVADDCNNISGHTFFWVRPQFQSASPERMVLWGDRITAKRSVCGMLQLVPFGGKSINRSGLGQFFMPWGSCDLDVEYVTEATKNSQFTPGAMSQQFGIYPSDLENGTFKSTICINPYQSVAGLGLTWRQYIWTLPDCDNHLWFEISSPIERVKNVVCLNEKLDPNNTDLIQTLSDCSLGLPQNMTEAFKQASWCYGKIDNCGCQQKVGLADIECKVGYEWLNHDCCFFESYAGILFPTGNAPTARYMFEPILGHNKHYGVLFGTSGIFEFRACENECNFALAIDYNGLYLADRVERRSFDLNNCPWSRYMQVYLNMDQALEAQSLYNNGNQNKSRILYTPGINVFTKDMIVTPGLANTLNTALIYNQRCFELELGYNFYVRDAETVRLACCWQEGPALKAITDGQGYTNAYQCINNFVVSTDTNDQQPKPVVGGYGTGGNEGYGNNLIRAKDLDLQSAAMPAILTNTVYGSLGWHWDDCKYPLFVGLGASYEMVNNNAALERWLAWGKFGWTF